MCTLSVSNVIYHKFSHGAAFYTLNGKNVNVMLEFSLILLGSVRLLDIIVHLVNGLKCHLNEGIRRILQFKKAA